MAPLSTQELQRRIFLDIVRSLPELSLAGLARLIDHRFAELARQVTVGDLIGNVGVGQKLTQASNTGDLGQHAPSPLLIKRGRGRPKGSKTKNRTTDLTAPAAPRPVLDDVVETRTQAGRDRYDAALHHALKHAGRPMSAVELRAAAGGDDVQARRALNRLIEQGKVGYQGVTRATRYFLQ